MKKLLSIVLTVFLFTGFSFAQTSTKYFPNVLIIKYETEDVLLKLNPNQGPSIQQQVESALSEYGLVDIEPIWKDEYSNQLRKTLALKRKSIRAENLSAGLSRIFEVKYSSEIDPVVLARKISNMPGVEYAEPRYIFQTSLVPNDPLTSSYTTLHNFEEAWDVTTGSSDVIIGIVDTGVNYLHEDLKNKAWVNEDEIPDNGIDDDDNGFVDDYLGWDFFERVDGSNVISDNNPFAEFNDHGTIVAGIATAEANNGVGIAGTGFNSRYMAIKSGGREDLPETEDDESRSIPFGLEGIIYGVLNGADIINASWGGNIEGLSTTANYSLDVANFAIEAGVLIVSSSGNSNSTDFNYISSFDGILSVGSVTSAASRSNFSNYGYSVDVFALGSSVRSAVGVDTTGYGFASGTSMSSPVVAGLAGLIKSEYPDWSARRILHQIRSTSVAFDSPENPLLLGKGMIDAYAALTDLKPGISVRNSSFSDKDGTSLSVGESGVLELMLINFAESSTSLSATLTVLQDDILITEGVVSIGALATNDSTIIEFQFDIPDNFDLELTPTFVVSFEDPDLSYTDFDVVQYEALSFGVMNANNITMSFGANGTIGFSDPSSATGGIGFIPEGFSNILYEAGIIMMEDGNIFLNEDPLIANNVRGSGAFYNSDFDPDVPYIVNNPGEVADAQGSGSFVPNSFSDLSGFQTQLNTFAYADEDVLNAVFTQYLITNVSGESQDDFYMGVFSDWDVNNYANNSVIYDPTNEFMYIFDSTVDNDYPYVAIIPMQTASSNLAIDNGYSGTDSPYRFNLYDGYTDEEKANSLKAGTNNANANGADVSTVVASGPYDFYDGVSISLGFIYVYGADYPELRDNVLAAKAKNVFPVDEPGLYTSSEIETDIPKITRLSQNYPNPFNPSTEINFELAESGFTELKIFNVLGQEVQTLINEVRSAGRYNIQLNANALNSGIYFAVLKSGDFSQTIKMTLIK